MKFSSVVLLGSLRGTGHQDGFFLCIYTLQELLDAQPMWEKFSLRFLVQPGYPSPVSDVLFLEHCLVIDGEYG